MVVLLLKVGSLVDGKSVTIVKKTIQTTKGYISEGNMVKKVDKQFLFINHYDNFI